MQTVEFNKPQVIKYLAYTFGIAYIIQIAVAMLYRNGGGAIGQMIMAAMMFVPLICVKLSGGKAEGMVWKRLQIRRNYKTILLAWFLPAILTAIGTALYFLVFPGHFDLTGAYLADNGGLGLCIWRRGRLARLPLSAIKVKIRTQERLAPGRNHLGRVALAAHLADRLRVWIWIFWLPGSGNAAFLCLHSRAGNSVRLAVRAERKHLDAGDPSRSDQRCSDGALGNVLGLQRHHETPGAGAQRTHCRSAAPGVRGGAGDAEQGLIQNVRIWARKGDFQHLCAEP